MSNNSKIEWCTTSWNPITGCTKISPGCANCYSEVMSRRLQAMGQHKYRNNFKVTLHEEDLKLPSKWKKPQMIFVNSMSDLFHKHVPFDFVDKVFDVIMDNPQHIFQVLTKRSYELYNYWMYSIYAYPKNAWIGVSVENKRHGLRRIDDLREIPASVKFLSIEPLLEDLGPIDLAGIDWVICGGESGNKARPMKKEWVINIKDQCESAGVPFFFKQWGTWGSDGINRNKDANGSLLDGKEYKNYPNQKQQ